MKTVNADYVGCVDSKEISACIFEDQETNEVILAYPDHCLVLPCPEGRLRQTWPE
jgi:hypothetical protein